MIVVTNILVNSPQKVFIFIIQENLYRIKVSQRYLILKVTADITSQWLSLDCESVASFEYVCQLTYYCYLSTNRSHRNGKYTKLYLSTRNVYEQAFAEGYETKVSLLPPKTGQENSPLKFVL